MNTKKIKKNSGFTLVELSIVLVIIGLVVGGILFGQDLINAARVRVTVGQIEKFNTAAQTFRLKYGQLPGDFAKATTIWGAANSDPSTCLGTASTGTQTCDGNGNGQVEYTLDGGIFIFEDIHFWQHLSNANLISGNFKHYDDTDIVNLAESQIPLPTVVLKNARLTLSYSYGVNHQGFNGSIYILGSFPAEEDWSNGPLFTPVDAKMLDDKMDDGVPDNGTLKAYKWYMDDNNDCMTGTTPERYNLTNPVDTCAIAIKTIF